MIESDGEICRRLLIPDDLTILAAVGGALSELTKPYNWEQVGTMTPGEAAELMSGIVLSYFESSCEDETVPTPFWDEAQDLNDEETTDAQGWYGEVSDENAAPDEISFVENVGIWVITGFVAYAATPAAAIFFHTIAPRFVHAFHKGDVREIWRVVVDSADYGTVDTDNYPADAIIEIPIITDDTIETGHDIFLINMAIP